MSVYITRRKVLFGENDGVNTVNDTVDDTVKYIDNKGNSVRITTRSLVKTDTVKLNKNEKCVLQILNMDYNSTYSSLMYILQVARPTRARAIDTLQKNGLIVREGSDKTGHWYVTEKGKELL